MEITFPSSITEIAILSVSHVTRELPIALLSALRFVHPFPHKINCVGEYEADKDHILYIIICPAGLGSELYHVGPKYYITYQLEPTPILERESYRDFLSKALYNWDYSPKNVEYLQQFPEIKSIYVPPGYAPHIASPDVADGRRCYTDQEKDIDILFLGWDIYDRRRRIREMLEQVGLRVLFTTALDLHGMQEAIRRSKICLNIHGISEIVCLETIRLNILLSNQACVVNEDLDDNETLIYNPYIRTVPYDQLVSTCIDLIDRPEERQMIAHKSFQWYRREREWTQIVDFNALIPSLQ